jgi:molybdenum-dependent DNA-binding transcriptional regulator ModE
MVNKKKDSQKRSEELENLLNINLLNAVGRSLSGKPQDQKDLEYVMEATMLIKREDEIKKVEAVQNGKQGGRRPTFKKEEIMEEYEKLKGKHPKYSFNRLSELVAEDVKGSDRNIRRILSDILKEKPKK